MEKRTLTRDELDLLIDLLERRLAVIGDADLRESDPDEQLRRLREVSEQIDAFREERSGCIPVRLRHFLKSASLGKALDWAREQREPV